MKPVKNSIKLLFALSAAFAAGWAGGLVRHLGEPGARQGA